MTMTVKELVAKLQKLDQDLEVFATDPDSSNILIGFGYLEVCETKTLREYAWCETQSCNFPVGFKFVRLG